MPIAGSPAVAFTPSPTKVPTPENYLGSDDFNFLNQYYPELYTKIVDRYGSGDITGLLEMQGKEIPFASDNIKWTEEGRLTQLATGVTRSTNVYTKANHTFRIGETLMISDADGTALNQGRINAVTTNTFTVDCGLAGGWTVGTTALVVYADSNEFKKRTSGMSQSLNSQVSYFENTPVIVKEMVDESGSNLAQKTWLEITDSNGGVGYVWYYKNFKDTEKRFKNAIESKLIEGKRWEAGSDLFVAGYEGTQGLFSSISEGNVFEGMATDLDDFDEIIERMNAQGQLSQNYLYNSTAQGTAIDDMLKETSVTSLSWGAFENDEKMALTLEFSGFRRAGYEFYKSRSRYLDNPIGRGAIASAQKVHGFMLPYGSKNVYDTTQAKPATLPMIHVRYRANEKTNRKYMMTRTGAVEGNSRVDELIVDFTTERALCLLGRNNALIMTGS